MKKILIVISAFLFMIGLVNAQVPEKINYQAVARSAAGNILANTPISVRISINSGSPGGTNVYKEVHSATTNQFGLFTLQIGGGAASVGTFNSIDWSTGSFFVETEIDPAGGSSFTSVGTTQLMSVPYALFAKDGGPWKRDGNDISNTNTGNVGLGTTAPTARLEVNDDSGVIARFRKIGNTGVSESFQFESDSINSGNDLISLSVPVNAPDGAQFIEFEKGAGAVAAINANGDFSTTAKYTRNATADANLVPVAYGYISSSGAINASNSTSNFTCTKTATGVYQITINGVTNHNDLVVSVSPKNTGVTIPDFVNYGTATANLRVFTFSFSAGSFSAGDDDFSFIAYLK